MIFTRIARRKSPASTLALAVALATGAAVGATALEAPAYAQKKKKEKAAKTDYSEEFIAVYQPLAQEAQAEGADVAAVQGKIPGLVAAIQTDDDRNAAGGLIYQVGQKASDYNVQLQGLELMLASGKIPAENLASYNFQAGQFAYQIDDYAKARKYVQAAIDLGFSEYDPEVLVAETYFAEENYPEGLSYLSGAIDARLAGGAEVPEQWIRRGLAIAYNNSFKEEASRFARMFIEQYPSKDSWGDAIAIVLNTNSYENPEILDLMRLARRTETFRDDRMYLEYVDAADYRRLPGEVVEVIDEGYASGLLSRDNAYVADTRQQAQSRVAADKADMDGLFSNARKSGAALRSVMAAGDIALSYGNAAAAEEFYTKALGLAGVNTPLVLTRMGIAQLDQGKFAEAEATFNKVEGAREAIASLWAVYAKQSNAGG